MRRLAVLMSLVVLAGCSPDRAAAPGEDPPLRDEVGRAVVAFTDCLEEEGLSVSPARFDREGKVVAWPRYDEATSADAVRACRKHVTEVALPQLDDNPEYVRTARAFIECLSKRGVGEDKLPRLTPQGLILPRDARRDPEFRRAERRCFSVFREAGQ